MQMVKIYDTNELTLLACGIPVSGFAVDSVVKMERTEAAFVSKTGVDGQTTRSKTNNRHVKITFHLMQSSSSNDALSALHNIDLAASNGAGVAPSMILDRGGTSSYICSKSWIAKAPEPEFGQSAGAREWIIEGVLDNDFTGGN
jgi:hypothetical protein